MTAWLFLLPLPLGFLLDLCFGDPHWMPHPVRAIGWLIARLERLLRGLFPKTPKGERLAGVFLAALGLQLNIFIAAQCKETVSRNNTNM